MTRDPTTEREKWLPDRDSNPDRQIQSLPAPAIDSPIRMRRLGIADCEITGLRLRRHGADYACSAFVREGGRSAFVLGTGATADDAFAAFGKDLCHRLVIIVREDEEVTA